MLAHVWKSIRVEFARHWIPPQMGTLCVLTVMCGRVVPATERCRERERSLPQPCLSTLLLPPRIPPSPKHYHGDFLRRPPVSPLPIAASDKRSNKGVQTPDAHLVHSWVDWIFGLEKNPKIQHILDLELEFKSQWRTWTFDHWIGSKIQVQNFCGPELKWVVKVASAEHFCHRTLAKRAIQ